MKHLLLDEFQDTSRVQFDILQPLIEEIVSGVGVNAGGSFFFVGDVKQSIYRFRGGVSELFHTVANHFNVEIQPLKTNYRSRSAVVDFVNRSFASVMPHYIPQESPPHKKGGYVEVLVHEEPLVVLEKNVKELLEKGIAPEAIAILCVTNGDAAKVQAMLEFQGIKVVSEATLALIHQRSVRILIEYLRYCYFNAPLYRHNCAALLGIDPEEIKRTVIHNLQETCVAFIQHHAIGDGSALLFIEELERYADIEALIFEIERLETPAPKEQQKGIALMTVHKSKGLEFDHVIVLDRLGQMKSRNDFILYEYEGIDLERVFIRTKGREALDDRYALAVEKEAALERSDQLNALYVALTRAVESLRVVSKPKGSWFDPLALEEGHWGEATFDTFFAPQVPLLQPIELFPTAYGKQRQKGEEVAIEGVDYEAISYGLALHYGMEMMENFDPNALHYALLATQKRYALALGEVKMGLLSQTLSTLIGDTTFIHLTQGIAHKEQAILYRGQKWIIDLLVEHEEGYWVVIDYKSGEEYLAEHTQQVIHYTTIIQEMMGKEVRGYLCYAKPQECVWKRVQ
jgi:exodeoxyribonuclease V beta subunit